MEIIVKIFTTRRLSKFSGVNMDKLRLIRRGSDEFTRMSEKDQELYSEAKDEIKRIKNSANKYFKRLVDVTFRNEACSEGEGKTHEEGDDNNEGDGQISEFIKCFVNGKLNAKTKTIVDRGILHLFVYFTWI
jgi:hypothetical protein